MSETSQRQPPISPPAGTELEPEVSVVVPVYDEAESLPQLVAEIDNALAEGRPGGWRYEAIFVDDGSRDGSLRTLAALAAERPALRVLRMPENRGQSAALMAGFRAARAPVVVTLDADLQNDPADIPELLARLERCDLVSGIRARRRDSAPRRIASRIANAVRRRAVHDSVRDVGCSLKAYRASFLRQVPAWNGVHRFLPALLEIQGARVAEVPVNHRPRRHGKSKYTIGGRLWRGIVDLFGVRWLQSRWVDLRGVEELEPPERAG